MCDFDYNTPGAYFITVCTAARKCTLSHIALAIHESPAVSLTNYGKIVEKYINELPDRLKITVDRYVIMPNHVHIIAIVAADDEIRAIRESPLQMRSVISKMVGYVKMNVSREIRNLYGERAVWQRGFYDHIIRNRDEYEEISKYIYENPARWYYDDLYSDG